MATSEHNSDPGSDLDISTGGVLASREVSGWIDIEVMNQSPLEALREYDVHASEFAVPVIVTPKMDIDQTQIYRVAFLQDDGPFRLELIDRAIDALRMAREALTRARHVEQPGLSWHPYQRRGDAS